MPRKCPVIYAVKFLYRWLKKDRPIRSGRKENIKVRCIFTETYIAYFDETGDDGITTASSSHFVLTSLYMPASSWQHNFNMVKALRKELRDKYGFHVAQEMHTKNFLTDKNPYRDYHWSKDVKQEILKAFTLMIAELDLSIINVIIDKERIQHPENYSVLENALKYNIQRIDNDSDGKWNYIIITDRGRVGIMRKTARAIRAYNPIQSKYSFGFSNQPIKGLLEDILDKDSEESYFVQICDFVSYFVNLYFKIIHKHQSLPNRVSNVIDETFVRSVMATLKKAGKLNIKASPAHPYGLVIYPK